MRTDFIIVGGFEIRPSTCQGGEASVNPRLPREASATFELHSLTHSLSLTHTTSHMDH
jgi:hypothetical protein